MYVCMYTPRITGVDTIKQQTRAVFGSMATGQSPVRERGLGLRPIAVRRLCL